MSATGLSLNQALALLSVRGYEIGKTARCDGTPRIAVDGVLKTCEEIIALADSLRIQARCG